MGSPRFLARHQFLIRRLHSFLGLFPLGVFVFVHLTTNASILNGPGTFQKLVYNIHSLENALWVVEWAFIFTPLLFHALIGIWLSFEGRPNNGRYKYANNFRYTLQRATGLIAFAFIFWHVFHMHGWFHWEFWKEAIAPLHGGVFRPYSAATTGAEAMTKSIVIPILYVIGVLSVAFHLGNGVWTAGITWGVWVTAQAQHRANYIAAAVGILIAVIGLSGIYGFMSVDKEKARQIENEMYEAKVSSHEITPNEEKRAKPHEADPGVPSDTANVTDQDQSTGRTVQPPALDD